MNGFMNFKPLTSTDKSVGADEPFDAARGTVVRVATRGGFTPGPMGLVGEPLKRVEDDIRVIVRQCRMLVR